MPGRRETRNTKHETLSELFLPVYTAAQMQATDAAAIKGIGIPGPVLMERAGMGVAEHLLERYCTHHCFVVLAGKGNNGGDGFVMARHLLDAEADVRVFAAGRAADYKGDALLNLKILGKIGLKVAHAPSAATLRRALSGDCVIIDAIFGTGFSGEPRGKAAEFIKIAAAAADGRGSPVVAVDIASGVDSSTGEVAQATLPAESTVTFHAPKLGHVIEPGSYFCGDLILVDIGIPEEAAAGADHFIVDEEVIPALIPPKMEYDHKFSVGRVLVIGGSTGLTGAACMASESALRSGAGVVVAAVPASLNPVFEVKLLEVMTMPLAESEPGYISQAALPELLERLKSFDCAAIGPGLGRDPETAALVNKFLAKAQIPVVVDADALNAIAGKLGSLKKRTAPTVITPHTGELGRLLDVPAQDVAAHRLQYAKQAAKKSGAVVVLKGSSTIITDGVDTAISFSGNPGMATAGSGDVLTGVISTLMSKGMDTLIAAATGAFIHGTAAEMAAEDLNPGNLIASDLIDYLPLAFASLYDENCRGTACRAPTAD